MGCPPPHPHIPMGVEGCTPPFSSSGGRLQTKFSPLCDGQHAPPPQPYRRATDRRPAAAAMRGRRRAGGPAGAAVAAPAMHGASGGSPTSTARTRTAGPSRWWRGPRGSGGGGGGQRWCVWSWPASPCLCRPDGLPCLQSQQGRWHPHFYQTAKSIQATVKCPNLSFHEILLTSRNFFQ